MDGEPNEGKLIANDHVIEAMSRTVRDGSHGLREFPGLLKRAIREECWRCRVLDRQGVDAKEVRFESFREFMEALPHEGLGADEATIRRVCGGDIEALRLLGEALERGRGAPTGNQNAAKKAESKTNNDNVIVCSDSGQAEQGNSTGYAIRRLTRHRPDLLEKVESGELSCHRAMIEAGFRREPTPLELRRWHYARVTSQPQM